MTYEALSCKSTFQKHLPSLRTIFHVSSPYKIVDQVKQFANLFLVSTEVSIQILSYLKISILGSYKHDIKSLSVTLEVSKCKQ